MTLYKDQDEITKVLVYARPGNKMLITLECELGQKNGICPAIKFNNGQSMLLDDQKFDGIIALETK